MPFLAAPIWAEQIAESLEGCNEKHGMPGTRLHYNSFVLSKLLNRQVLDHVAGDAPRSAVDTIQLTQVFIHQSILSAAVPQCGVDSWCFCREASFFSVAQRYRVEGRLATALARRHLPCSPCSSLFASAYCQRTKSRKHCPQGGAHPLSNHSSQRTASSKARSKSCASSLRLTWPKRTRWLCNIA